MLKYSKLHIITFRTEILQESHDYPLFLINSSLLLLLTTIPKFHLNLSTVSTIHLDALKRSLCTLANTTCWHTGPMVQLAILCSAWHHCRTLSSLSTKLFRNFIWCYSSVFNQDLNIGRTVSVHYIWVSCILYFTVTRFTQRKLH